MLKANEKEQQKTDQIDEQLGQQQDISAAQQNNRAVAKTKAQTQQKRNPRGFENIVLADNVSIEGLDKDKVMQAWQGDSFGWMDLERYNKMEGSNSSKPTTSNTTAEAKSTSTESPTIPTSSYSPPSQNKKFGELDKLGPKTNQQTNDYFSSKAESDYQYSMKAFDVNDFLQKNIKKAVSDTKADDMYRGLKQGVHDTVGYYRNRSNLTTLGIFGDIWNTNQRPSWKSPGDPEKIETTYNKKDEDKD